MYQRPGKKGPLGLIVAIFAGLIAGAVFFLRDNPAPEPSVVQIQTEAPSLTPTPFDVFAFPTSIFVTPTLPPPAQYRMLIPDASINGTIVHLPFGENGTWDVSLLGSNLGHLQRTSWFDQVGNVVIVGHVELSDGRAGPFASLPSLDDGALIYILDSNNAPFRTYQVRETVVTTPTDISVLYPSPQDQLTLITCSSYDFFSNSYLERVVTIADRIA